MVTKKGVILTIVILVAITLGSFMMWIVPQNNQTSFLISDFENHLDQISDVHETIEHQIDEEFQNLLNKKINPEEYINYAKISSSQINSQIIQLVESDASEEWHESYLYHLESLKTFNTYLRETVVAANLIEDGKENPKVTKIFEGIESLKKDYKELIEASKKARP